MRHHNKEAFGLYKLLDMNLSDMLVGNDNKKPKLQLNFDNDDQNESNVKFVRHSPPG